MRLLRLDDKLLQKNEEEIAKFRSGVGSFDPKAFERENDRLWEQCCNTEWSKRQCAFCESTFDEDLTWTDGDGWFCEECAENVMGGLVTEKKGG